uniref:Large ribosomal subunit protein uL13c n=1 Tax=Trichogloeopsis pedicellata TaxID=1495610 RepID=A0A1G4P0P8_9FLOR|nr:Ribosomal protein L13 [Trichogloeopsis pedicellata]SCW24468.1 Ribosomal protein L13 [Trichogloeopsis pedicellata]
MNKTSIVYSDNMHKWYIINAKGHRVGRLATEIANILRGKRKVSFHPSQIALNHIIIINAQQIKISGRKTQQKLYYRHSGRPGNLKIERFNSLQNRLPHKIIENAVHQMLPKGPLGRKIFKNLKVYSGNTHPHQAQKPTEVKL